MMQPSDASGAEAQSEARPPSAESSSVPSGGSNSDEQSPTSPHSSSGPSALDERKEELILENIEKRKGELADGQGIEEVRQEVEKDFHVQNKGDDFELVRQLEKEVKYKNKPSPATNSAFNEIKDHQGKIQDGLGGGKPSNCSPQEKGETAE